MNVAINIHSQSGHSIQVARALSSKFTDNKHEVDLSLLRTSGALKPHSMNFELKRMPSVDGFDLVIVGGPVWAFSLSPVVRKYLREMGNSKGKKILCFVTKGLPFTWTGGSQALKVIERELELSGAIVLPSQIIWAKQVVNAALLEKFVERVYRICTE